MFKRSAKDPVFCYLYEAAFIPKPACSPRHLSLCPVACAADTLRRSPILFSAPRFSKPHSNSNLSELCVFCLPWQSDCGIFIHLISCQHVVDAKIFDRRQGRYQSLSRQIRRMFRIQSQGQNSLITGRSFSLTVMVPKHPKSHILLSP